MPVIQQHSAGLNVHWKVTEQYMKSGFQRTILEHSVYVQKCFSWLKGEFSSCDWGFFNELIITYSMIGNFWTSPRTCGNKTCYRVFDNGTLVHVTQSQMLENHSTNWSTAIVRKFSEPEFIYRLFNNCPLLLNASFISIICFLVLLETHVYIWIVNGTEHNCLKRFRI